MWRCLYLFIIHYLFWQLTCCTFLSSLSRYWKLLDSVTYKNRAGEFSIAYVPDNEAVLLRGLLVSPVWVSNFFTSQFRKVRLSLSEFRSKPLIYLTDVNQWVLRPNSPKHQFYFRIIINQRYTLYLSEYCFSSKGSLNIYLFFCWFYAENIIVDIFR